MARRAVLHSALFKNGLSKGSESAPGCKVTPRCPQPGSRESPTRACGVLGFTILPPNPRDVNTGRHSPCAWNRSHRGHKALKSG